VTWIHADLETLSQAASETLILDTDEHGYTRMSLRTGMSGASVDIYSVSS
jgi:hypothetical protein